MGLFRRQSPKDRFARDVLAAVWGSGRVAEATYDPEAFAIRFRRHDEDGSGWIYLDNTFRECDGAGRAERSARIRNLVTAVVTSSVRGVGWDEVAPRLRPVLRGAAFGQTAHADAKPLLGRPALPYLVELVVIDTPVSMAYVTRAQAVEWGVDEALVFATARENLDRLAEGTGRGEPSGQKTMLHFADTGDAYFTSMLLSDGFLARLAPMVGGRPVAFVPDRSALIVAADDPQSLPGLVELMERQFSEAPRGLSPMAYTCDESGRVVPYTASEPGRLADLIHRCEVMLAAGEYQSQKAALDEIHERDQKDIFVGTLLVAGRDDGTVFSVAVWSDECVTLLPRADLVCFQSDADSVMVPWPVVARTVGLKPEPGLMPERYLVTAWPEASLLEHLRAEAVTP